MDFSPYRRVLVVGAGSGRDMASAVLLTEHIRTFGAQIDLAGFLTPWATHTFHGRWERPINVLDARSVKRLAGSSAPLASYFERFLPALHDEMRLGTHRFFVFSLHRGTVPLRRALTMLVRRNRYDLVLAVDAGGDALATNATIGQAHTPIVDHACLAILAAIPATAEKILAVIAPGADGELTPSELQHAIARHHRANAVIGGMDIVATAPEYRTYHLLERRLAQRTGVSSVTASTLDAVVRGRDQAIQRRRFHRDYKVGAKRWRVTFSRSVAPSLVRRVLFFDLTAVARASGLRVQFPSVLEAQLRFRGRANGTEVDGALIPLHWPPRPSQVAYSLTPMHVLRGMKRTKMLRAMAMQLRRRQVPYILLMTEDVPRIPMMPEYHTQWRRRGFVLLRRRSFALDA